MAKHTLDLLENAVDSLEEALQKFEQGDAGDLKAYKFCVLHMAHFIELIFKHHITKKHPLLIFLNPFDANLKKDKAKTIGLWDAVNFINNEEANTVAGAFRNDLEWLKKLRNEIEHHKFEMDVEASRSTIGRLFRSVLSFLESESDVEMESLIRPGIMATFKVLSDEYEFKLNDALREAQTVEDENPADHKNPGAPLPRLDCNECGNETLVINEQSSTGYRCTFCGNEEGDHIPSHCDCCGAECDFGDLSFSKDEDGRMEGRCYYCSGRYAADRAD